MKGLLTEALLAAQGGGNWYYAREALNGLRKKVPDSVRAVVERYEHACLDNEKEREALIKALVEALS